MTGNVTPQTVATIAGDPDDGITPAAVADGATTTTGDGRVAGIDPRAVVRLAMYPREAIYLVDLTDGRQRQVEPDDWHALVHTVASHPDSRLFPVTAGCYDIIWRVEWTTREED